MFSSALVSNEEEGKVQNEPVTHGEIMVNVCQSIFDYTILSRNISKRSRNSRIVKPNAIAVDFEVA